jgi:hypothetical protein
MAGEPQFGVWAVELGCDRQAVDVVHRVGADADDVEHGWYGSWNRVGAECKV